MHPIERIFTDQKRHFYAARIYIFQCNSAFFGDRNGHKFDGIISFKSTPGEWSVNSGKFSYDFRIKSPSSIDDASAER